MDFDFGSRIPRGETITDCDRNSIVGESLRNVPRDVSLKLDNTVCFTSNLDDSLI